MHPKQTYLAQMACYRSSSGPLQAAHAYPQCQLGRQSVQPLAQYRIHLP
uniref:Uncharacterized protein n=1 Tax=Rhizophora mucronata TaxID=61149 RepID=A0A2P2P849_RHIMU